jgi:hypothetical protein
MTTLFSVMTGPLRSGTSGLKIRIAVRAKAGVEKAGFTFP